jgi:hypothetical protein
MSTRIFDAYLYDKPEDDLLLELNSIRDAYMAYLKADIKKDPNKWMRCGRQLVDLDVGDADDSFERALRYIRYGFSTELRGDPLDVAGNCVVVKHAGKTVIWLFPGYNFGKFAKNNEILQRIHKNEYWWQDQSDVEFDTPEEEEAYDKRGEFWESAFERFKSYVPSRMGLVYEFFTNEDVLRLGDFLHMEYDAYLKRGGQ